MPTARRIEEHADSIDATVKEFSNGVSKTVRRVSSFLGGSAARAAREEGYWQPFVSTVDRNFVDAFRSDGYNALVIALSDVMWDQIEWFRAMYSEMSEEIEELPEDFELTQDDMISLQGFVASAMVALNAVVSQEGSRLLGKMSRLSGSDVAPDLAHDLVSSAALNVESASIAAAKDLLTSMFRLVSYRVYSNLRSDGPLQFEYVGPRDMKNRPFCARILDSSQTYTYSDIKGMDNHQIPDVFVNAGGYNCRHWWSLSGVRA